MRVNDGNDFAGPVCRLLVARVVGIGGYTSVDKGVGRGRRERDGRGDLLHWLDLMLQRRGIRRVAGERRAVGRS